MLVYNFKKHAILYRFFLVLRMTLLDQSYWSTGHLKGTFECWNPMHEVAPRSLWLPHGMTPVTQQSNLTLAAPYSAVTLYWAVGYQDTEIYQNFE